jgi:DNA-binding GntR family transcriptional regulator
MKKYIKIRESLKKQIQLGEYVIDDFLPSENDLCKKHSITRTTARKALDELVKEGFIERQHGKGSRVIERRKSLGLLNVKGFSEAVGENFRTEFLHPMKKTKWPDEIILPVENDLKKQDAVFLNRLRYVGNDPVLLNRDWFSDEVLPGLLDLDFIDGSFFKTLSQRYLIEITGSEHELRAEPATPEIAEILKIDQNYPILHISIKFHTSNPKLIIYSELYCNTKKFPIGSSYKV